MRSETWKKYYDAYKYPMSKTGWFKKFHKIKTKYQDRWRDKIFMRDGDQCVICGRTKELQLCHITSVFEFIRTYAIQHNKILPGKDLETIMKQSYRYDNLITMCARCHLADHQRTYTHRWIKDKINETKCLFKEKRKWKTAKYLLEHEKEDIKFTIQEIWPKKLKIITRPNERAVLLFSTKPKYMVFHTLAGWTEEEMKKTAPQFLPFFTINEQNKTISWEFSEHKLRTFMSRNVKRGIKRKIPKSRIRAELSVLSQKLEDDLNQILIYGLKKEV